MTSQNQKIYTTFQIAKICGVKPTTIIKWINDNKIKSYVTPGGHRRVQENNLIDFLKKYNFPMPDHLQAEKLQILVIDDDASVGGLLKKALKKEFGSIAEVDWVTDGVNGLLILGKRHVDLVILDTIMPMMDGGAVLATLRSNGMTQGIKVIGVTGQTGTSGKIEFIKQHTDAFFRKPFDIALLIEKVRELLDLKK